jgi:hypothetical protein
LILSRKSPSLKAICVANNEEKWSQFAAGSFIDSHDLVIRYGKCRHLGGNAGSKVDLLFVQRDRSVIEDGDYPERLEIIKNQQPTIVLVCWKWSQEELNTWIKSHSIFNDCPLLVLTEVYKRRLCNKLKKYGSKVPNQPSVGIWAHEYIRDAIVPAYTTYLYGFDHVGTDHHDWVAEKAYIEDEIAKGIIKRC